MSEKETITRVYELGYILVPTAPEAEVPGLVDALKASITKAGGTVSSEGAPEFIDLAYTMEKSVASKKYKYSQGYFGWIKFETTPEQMEVLKKALDSMLEVVRYILVKTSIENAVVFKKPKIEARRTADGDDMDIVVEETGDEDLKDDHEMLPDVASDIAEAPVPATEEPVEKESE